MRALNLAQSISGAFSALRSPSSSDAATATGGTRTSGGLPAVVEGGAAPTGCPVSDSIPTTMFSCPGAADFKVRGPTYLQDKKKVRTHALSLLHIALHQCSGNLHGLQAVPAPPLSAAHLLVLTAPVNRCNSIPVQACASTSRVWCLSHCSAEPAVLHPSGAWGVFRATCSSLGFARIGIPSKCENLVQVLPDAPVCSLVSLNLVSLAEPTFHIARFLPSVRESKAPLLFIWHVSSCIHHSFVRCLLSNIHTLFFSFVLGQGPPGKLLILKKFLRASQQAELPVWLYHLEGNYSQLPPAVAKSWRECSSALATGIGARQAELLTGNHVGARPRSVGEGSSGFGSGGRRGGSSQLFGLHGSRRHGREAQDPQDKALGFGTGCC